MRLLGKHLRGRPAKFKSVADLERQIERYFFSCWTQKLDRYGTPIFVKDRNGKKTTTPVMIQNKPYTITGLAVFLGTTRDVLIDYEAKKDFSYTIKRAKQCCEAYAEEQLFIGRNPTGAIFNLKNNYGWNDKTQTEHSGNLVWLEEPPR